MKAILGIPSTLIAVAATAFVWSGTGSSALALSVQIDGTPVTLSSTDTGISSYSLGNVTVGNNPNRLLVVAFDTVGANGISSVTYGGSPLTQATFTSGYWGSRTSGIYYLTNPAAGTANLTVNWTSTINWLGMISTAFSLYNVDQDAPLVAANKNGAGGEVAGPTSVSINLGTTQDVWLLDIVNLNTNATNLAPASGQTAASTTLFNGVMNYGVSYETIPSGGNQTQLWNYTNGSQWTHLAAGFRPIPEPATASLLLFGGALALWINRRNPRS
jgi:hypothetical protein